HWRFLGTRLDAGDREAAVQPDPHRGATCAHDLQTEKSFVKLARFVQIAALQRAVREHSNLKNWRRFRLRLMFVDHFASPAGTDTEFDALALRIPRLSANEFGVCPQNSSYCRPVISCSGWRRENAGKHTARCRPPSYHVVPLVHETGS